MAIQNTTSTVTYDLDTPPRIASSVPPGWQDSPPDLSAGRRRQVVTMRGLVSACLQNLPTDGRRSLHIQGLLLPGASGLSPSRYQKCGRRDGARWAPP